jgi:hypothetical protein
MRGWIQWLFLVSIGAAMPAHAQMQRTYTDPYTQISIDLPVTWRIGPNACDAYATNLRAPDWPRGVGVTVMWSPVKAPPHVQAAPYPFEGTEQAWKVAGQPGRRIILAPEPDSDPDDTQRKVTYETYRNGHQVLVIGIAPGDLFEKYLPAFDAVVAGIHWARAGESKAEEPWLYEGEGFSFTCPPGWRASEPGVWGCEPALIFLDSKTYGTMRVEVSTGDWKMAYDALLSQFESDPNFVRVAMPNLAGHPAVGIGYRYKRYCSLRFVTQSPGRYVSIDYSVSGSEPPEVMERRLETMMKTFTWRKSFKTTE